jgi:nucleoid DNA-binding protein
LQLNPKALEKIKIPAKTVFKFRVANAAKDAILGAKKESGFRDRQRYDSSL